MRLGQAVAFLPETMLAESPLAGIAVVAVENVSGSELHLAWAQDATSAEIARFVRSATQDGSLPDRATVPPMSA